MRFDLQLLVALAASLSCEYQSSWSRHKGNFLSTLEELRTAPTQDLIQISQNVGGPSDYNGANVINFVYINPIPVHGDMPEGSCIFVRYSWVGDAVAATAIGMVMRDIGIVFMETRDIPRGINCDNMASEEWLMHSFRQLSHHYAPIVPDALFDWIADAFQYSPGLLVDNIRRNMGGLASVLENEIRHFVPEWRREERPGKLTYLDDGRHRPGHPWPYGRG